MGWAGRTKRESNERETRERKTKRNNEQEALGAVETTSEGELNMKLPATANDETVAKPSYATRKTY